ncbi:rhamnogalacturonan endolyase [Filimonas zeae]|uniref:DUF6250 domain-containing protein n=1 Tax=Filimonas zeae TaxID=1737353 RepID=A0A917MXJ8_9BACT|nr:DUF6250 domain-containing protein [Filimonas zeae]MDR6341459.1 rhamnogalacturonan endolyase [Filimonas zeae]GGH75765.1 hypothetical protein GCM10011379_39670 [Filimonas zeae]
MMKQLSLLLILICTCGYILNAQDTSTKRTIVWHDDFEAATLDSTKWIAEIAPQPRSSVYIEKGRLILDTKGGVTVWLNVPLTGNYAIEYDRTVLMDSGVNDRVSDLNQFWAASDPHNANLFTRNGVLESYDSLQLYYVGMGGNTNKTTRFRKYPGTGERTLLQEFTDAMHLLQANKTYHVKTVVENGTTGFWIDGERYFFYTDPNPLRTGYFGLRSTKSRQAIDNVVIYALP